MFDFHKDKLRYFNIQREVTQENVIPFIEKHIGTCQGKHILEIGCAEAGVLKAFIEKKNTGVGVELSESRYQIARKFLSEDIENGFVNIINKNIYDIENPKLEFGKLFDVIVLKDVIEHIPDQDRFIPILKKFLTKDGVIFFAYPPWWMPFGGHQQICNSKWLRTLPWFHLLPLPIYKMVLKLFMEKEATIKELLEVKETGINIDRMYQILSENQFTILGEIFWLINPIYQFKFGLKKRKVFSLLSNVPVLRNFYTTAHYVLFKV
ncbi:MAG: methyltransferase domain-containing protein [Saprospiraceae bacterium]|nr:methyltransferase domain-containing protein [Saprospiraceae bacterium]